MRRSLLTLAGALALAALVPAQSDFDWHVPIHRPADSVAQWWAGGDDFKVRFDADGATFYPRLGPARENRPFGMRFGGVRVGGTAVAANAPVVRASDWRFVFDRGVVSEEYEVREEGVEQRFVFAERPAGDGAIRVVVDLATDLVAESRVGAMAIDFDDDGAATLRYGAAIAFDATGARTDVTTRYADGRIELEVPAGFVADATFPLTIDPLVNTTAIYSSPINSVESVAIASDLNESGLTKVCSVVSRIFSGTDSDLFGFVSPVDYTTVSPIYLDLDTNFGSSEGSVAYVGGGTPQFVLVHERVNVNTGQAFVVIYAHDRVSLVVNNGQSAALPLVASEKAWRPQVGGTRTGTRAMVVFDHESAGGVHTVQGCRVDLSPLVLNTPFLIAGATTSNERRPSINPLTFGATAWRAVYLDVGASQSVLQGVEISYSGAVVSTQALRTINVAPAESPILPKIAGEADRYLATVVQRNGGSVRLVGRRVDWPDFSSRIVRYTKTIVDNGTADIHNGGVAYD
ncbi:MAG: hypothetical protein KDB80_01410, partial [Planctomycetes bacterium]|nr:hypothetical protein [Planctomycetota bacterium]